MGVALCWDKVIFKVNMFYRLIVVAALTLVPQTQAVEYLIKTSGNCEVELTEAECEIASGELFSSGADPYNRVVRGFQGTTTNQEASKCFYHYSSTIIASYTKYSTAETSGSCGSSTRVCVCGIPPAAEVREPNKSEMLAFIQDEQSCGQ